MLGNSPSIPENQKVARSFQSRHCLANRTCPRPETLCWARLTMPLLPCPSDREMPSQTRPALSSLAGLTDHRLPIPCQFTHLPAQPAEKCRDAPITNLPPRVARCPAVPRLPRRGEPFLLKKATHCHDCPNMPDIAELIGPRNSTPCRPRRSMPLRLLRRQNIPSLAKHRLLHRT